MNSEDCQVYSLERKALQNRLQYAKLLE